ncbi:hypothetical protein [Sphingomonas sp. SUN039]|uniref:hypothetical protein n=1 Tax=Sphingomonas sp. SUN039 TaxID=2937787 RepID=UPI0021641411|nr:hypothetical protein [Sphingomonas sp. SUN039]UVO54205.1 hypothetical protein M0209_08760 [Sphingomonas sp. SUN039]
MASIPEDTIVCTGHYDEGGDFLGFSTVSSSGVEGWSPRNIPPDAPGENPDLAISIEIVVRNPNNKQSAKQAAQRLITAISRIRAKLSENPNKFVIIKGTIFTTAQILTSLENTQWTVSDRPPSEYKNEGVGSSNYDPNGTNADEINFEGILGYAHPNYPDDEGMSALVLHELAHLTEGGYNFFVQNYTKWQSEPAAHRGDFYPSDYSRNVEAFANDLMHAMSAEISLDVEYPAGQLVTPGGYTGPVDPQQIYNTHSSGW